MERREFIKQIAKYMGAVQFMPLGSWAAGMSEDGQTMPVIFVGHGSPMNAIEDNVYSRTWAQIGKEIPRPKAILCISAHWETYGTWVTAMEKPKTIHDFGGFPPALFAAQYPAAGSPALAKETVGLIHSRKVELDHEWGLDHGSWSVLKPMFPKADIPVFQMSLDVKASPETHYALGAELSALRKKGVLILGSGNIVHNLGRMQWSDKAYDWALEFDAESKHRIEQRNFSSLIDLPTKTLAAKLSVPSWDHYLPLLYITALIDPKDKIRFFNEQVTMGSISMRSFVAG